MKPLFVRAQWDDEAMVRVAVSDDVPGLATAAETSELLIVKPKRMIPDLMVANGMGRGQDLPFELQARRFELAPASA